MAINNVGAEANLSSRFPDRADGKQWIIHLRSLTEYFLLLLLFFIPVWPDFAAIKFGSLPDINLQRLLYGPLVFSWILFMLLTPGSIQGLSNIIRRFKILFLFLCIYFSINFISAIQSTSIRISLYAALNDALYLFTLFIISVAILNKPSQIKRIFTVLLLSGILVSILGIMEFFKGSNLFAGLIPVSTEYIESAMSAKSREYYRIQSTFANPLGFAQYLLLLIPAALYSIVYSSKRFNTVLGILFLLTGSAALIMTRARSPLIVILLLISLLIIKYYSRQVRKKMPVYKASLLVSAIPVVTAAVVFSLILIVSMFRGRTDLEIGSNMVRYLQLKKGIPKILEKPLIGYGRGMAPDIIQVGRYGSDRYTVDNYYLSVAVDTGIPNLIVFLLIFIIILKLCRNKGNTACLGNELNTMYWSILAFMISIGASSLRQSFPIVFIMFAVVVSIRVINSSVTEGELGKIT